LRGGFREFQKQIGLAQRNSAEERTFYQRKILDLGQRIGRYQTLCDAFRPLTSTLLKGNRVVGPGQLPANVDEAVWKRLMQQIPMANQALTARQPPLVVPVGPSEQPWVAYAAAHDSAQVDLYRGKQGPPPILAKMEAIFDSYSEQRADAFNLAVTEYRQLLDQKELPGYDGAMTDFEAYFNHFAPFYHLIPWYVFALLLTVFGWLVAASPRAANVLRSSAFWLVVCAFVIHTLALAARVMISGRPPVTNLYSSAVFIGWGCVLIGLVLEGVFRLGVGNFVSAVSGIGTLIIAHFLAGDGDTIRVLQAVLDTQFWLTTHVLTITLGYSATFFAGLLGAFLVAWHLFRPIVTVLRRHKVAKNRNLAAGEHVADAGFVRVERTVGSMMFGTICFAAFLSFVGTVLGGLWADDSWGRFWGWDPKENGALIIVLWDTLVLHLYASRLVGVRGLALLAIGGNIVTAWSWFGVNELGVGLHSYGFTEGAARALLLFWISQLVIIAIGLGPTVFHHLRRRWRPAGHAAP
jgi:ABC-type transport system involved in cytochrome c biogenesis permease subunit